MEKDDQIQKFANDVLEGLLASPKYLSSKYFYNELGNRLFEEIMQLPEYYLTRSEFEIFSTQSAEIVSSIANPFHVVELGPGNGIKTKLFLKEAAQQKKILTYFPIDISKDALELLIVNLQSEINVPIQPVTSEYMAGLQSLSKVAGNKLILFMGSNIGNFNHVETLEFFSTLSSLMETGDYFLIGFDLKKDPELILAAYNDSRGITRAFNLNLLHRINHQLGANFDVTQYKHYPSYDPMSGEARSYLISKKKQSVFITALQHEFHFEENEAVYMEVSRKYDVRDIENYASTAGLRMVKVFKDCKHYFADALFVKG